MAFLGINDTVVNSEHIGRVIPNEKDLTVTYEFLGGRIEVEQFDSLEAMTSKLQTIIAL